MYIELSIPSHDGGEGDHALNNINERDSKHKLSVILHAGMIEKLHLHIFSTTRIT